MSSPKHYPTYRIAQTEELSKSLVVATNGIILCRGYGRIDQSAATDEYWIQFLHHKALPANGASISNGALSFVSSPIVIDHTNGTHSTFSFDFTPDYVKCRNGLILAVSTTEYSFTKATADILTATVFAHPSAYRGR